MERPRVIVLPLTAPDPHQAELAAGMQAIWAAAMQAGGADVIALPREPDVDFGAAVVLGELRFDADGWRIRARIRFPDASETILVGRPRRTIPGVLDVMVDALREVIEALGLYMPPYIRWCHLLDARTVEGAIEELRRTGQDTLRRSDAAPTMPSH